MTRASNIQRARASALARLQGVGKQHRQAADQLRNGLNSDKAAVADLKLWRQYVGVIAGFFPTPPILATRLVEMSDLRAGMTIREPSAGAGHIADAIFAAGHVPFCIEINPTLCSILERKGYPVECMDFLDSNGVADRFIMNPKFEGGADIDQVRHAYDLLRPRGQVTAIMSATTMTRTDKKARQFQTFFERYGSTNEYLPTGTFSYSETNVNAILVTLCN